MSSAEESAAWRVKNPERYRELAQRNYLANKPALNVRRVKNRRTWRAQNPEASREQRWREQGIKDASWEMYDAKYKAQDGKCALCRISAPPHSRKGLFLDHDHSTGLPRELLCANCNTGLGMFKDDFALVAAALNYMTPEYGGMGSGCI